MKDTRAMGSESSSQKEGREVGSAAVYPKSNSQGLTAGISSDSMDRFVQCFERSARRWEIVVYPALFAFVLLAGYGFFLIYSLTGDMRTMARSIDPNMYGHMDTMSRSVAQMTNSLNQVSANMETVSKNLADVSQKMNALDPMLVHMTNMDRSMRAMVMSNDQMRQSMAVMTHNVARPMSIMNSFLP